MLLRKREVKKRVEFRNLGLGSQGAATQACSAAAHQTKHGDTSVDQWEGRGVDTSGKEGSVGGEYIEVNADSTVGVEMGQDLLLESVAKGGGNDIRLPIQLRQRLVTC